MGTCFPERHLKLSEGVIQSFTASRANILKGASCGFLKSRKYFTPIDLTHNKRPNEGIECQ